VTRVASVIAILFVLIVGTANSGGYRFGASDQAFYIPAVSLSADPSLFPRDRAVFEPQMRLWIGDEILGGIVRTTGVSLEALFAGLYVITMAGLALALIALARALGCNWWTIAVALVLVTLRHRIARTGANSLEGYMHPRMLAFALGLAAFVCIVRLRPAAAVAWTIAAAVVHTSTAIWFAGAVMVAAAWPWRDRRAVQLTAAAAIAFGLAALAVAVTSLPRMDAEWLAVLGDRDYLFSADWPLYAWLGNLAYPAVLIALYRQRRNAGVTTPGEASLLAGLLALILVFLISIPLAELHIAFFVQLQANRIFWLLDVVTVVYVAWWLSAVVMSGRSVAARAALVGLLAMLAIGRGVFVLNETGRPLAQLSPAADDDWLDVMAWLRTQPASWHVLADPGHAWKFGISLRAAALRDTPLEFGKDPAMAMYDHPLATRVAERRVQLADFDGWSSSDDVRRADDALDLDAFVDTASRSFDLPVLFKNKTFVVYDLR